jgi:hypothetical protein
MKMKIQKKRADKTTDPKIVKSGSSAMNPPVSGISFIDSLVSQQKPKSTNSSSETKSDGTIQRVVIKKGAVKGVIADIDTDNLVAAQANVAFMIQMCLETPNHHNHYQFLSALEVISQNLVSDESLNAQNLLAQVKTGLRHIKASKQASVVSQRQQNAEWKLLPQDVQMQILNQQYAHLGTGDPADAEERRLARGGEIATPLHLTSKAPEIIKKEMSHEEFIASRTQGSNVKKTLKEELKEQEELTKRLTGRG